MSGYEQSIDVLPGLCSTTSSDSASYSPSTESQGNGIVVGVCEDCGVSVGFHPPLPNVEASRWYCLSCNSICFANANPNARQKYLGVAPLATDAFVTAIEAPWPLEQHGGGDPPSPQLIRLVKRLCNQEYCGVERRRYQRFPLVAAVTVTPLDEHFRIIGLPLRMATTNISHDGVSLIHQSEHDAACLAIDFSESGFPLSQAIVRPVRMRSLGLVHETGGRFVRGLKRRAD